MANGEELYVVEWETTIRHSAHLSEREIMLHLDLTVEQLRDLIDADAGPEADRLENRLAAEEDEQTNDGVYGRVLRDVRRR